MPREESGPHGAGCAEEAAAPAAGSGGAANDAPPGAQPTEEDGPSPFDVDLFEVWLIDDLPPLTHKERGAG